jgi:hypothetical protein
MMTNYTSWAIQVAAIMEDQGVSLAIKLARMDVDMRKDKKLQAHLLETLLVDLLMLVVKEKTRKEV